MTCSINRRRYKLVYILCLQTFLAACSPVYKTTGNVLIGFAEQDTVPFVMASGDIDMSCEMSRALSPFILSFSRVTEPPNKLGVMLYLHAGSCAEFAAWEEELRYLRAVRSKNAAEAEDARISQKRWLALAARRHLTGYRSLAAAIAEPGDTCPEFDDDRAEFYWLIGLVNGLQAMLDDLAAGGTAGVPLGIAAKVSRGAACLNDEKWWGVPNGIRAAIWVNIPSNKPANADPLTILDRSMEIGIKQGIRLSHVLAAKIHYGLGNTERVKAVLRSYRQAAAKSPGKPEYLLFEEFAFLQLQAVSDRLWTEATGKRTPISGLGTFWDDRQPAIETIDIDDML